MIERRPMMTIKRCATLILIAAVVAIPGLSQADSITTKTYKKLVEIQELMAAEDIGLAISELEVLATEVEADSLDLALTLQTLGYAKMSDEKFDEAIDYLRRSLALDKLPENVKYNVGYMVAQLYAAQSQYDEALDFAAEWFMSLEAPNANQLIFMANIFAQNNRYAEAIQYAERAIVLSPKPRESWYQLITASYFQMEDFAGAAKTLSTMVTIWSDKAGYWEQLASVYLSQDSEARALGVLKLAWLSGVLEKESSIRTLVQLTAARGIPERAARLINAAFEQALLEENAQHLNLLASALTNAKEYESAVAVLGRLAEVKGKGDPLVRAANLNLERGLWSQAQGNLEKALEIGVEKAGNAYLLLGIVLTEQKKFGENVKALQKAQTFKDTSKQAARWIRYARDIRKQYEWQQAYAN